MQKRILILEDEPDLAAGLKNQLELEGHRVDVVYDGNTAIERLKTEHYDGLLVDLMVPGVNGFAVIAAARERGDGPGILVLTGRDTKEDEERAMALGADVYMTKPFSLLELVARMNALVQDERVLLTPAQVREARRVYGTDMKGDPFRDGVPFGDCVYYPHMRQVLRGGRIFMLTPRESDLLAVFLKFPGQTLSRVYLLREVCGGHGGEDSRTIDHHVSSLRVLIGDDPHNPRHIKTIRGRGYMFVMDL